MVAAIRTSSRLARETQSTQSILSDAQGLMFESPHEWKEFQEKHQIGLTNSQESLFNNRRAAEPVRRGPRMIREVFDEILMREDGNPLGKYQPFVHCAIKHHRQLLKFAGTAQRMPLAAAIDHFNDEFVFLVLEYADKIEDLLGAKSSTYNCIQNAIKRQSPFAEAMIAKLQNELDGNAKTEWSGPSDGLNSKENLFLAEAENQMTALHIAAEDIEPNPEEQFKFETWNGPTRDREVLESGDEDCVQDPERPSGQGTAPKRHTATPGTDGKTRLEISSEVDKVYQFKRLHIVRALIEAEPEALCKKNAKGDTPFQARLQSLAQSMGINVEDSDEDSDEDRRRLFDENRRRLFDEDEILAYMREYIIENFSRKKAMDALYKEGSGKSPQPMLVYHRGALSGPSINSAEGTRGRGPARPQRSYIARTLTFDLFGLPYPSIDADFLKGLGKVLRFEGLLKYVALPRVAFRDCRGLKFDENEADPGYSSGTSQKPSQDPRDEGKGRQDMCDVFQWLRDCGVSSIMTVKVIDDSEFGHSDEAIERCISGFGVRSWNWYRIDLPCDVILTSAENVREVALCSSGNNAVLAGWSSPSGLVKLDKLEKVHIVFQKGLERKSRLEKYADDFKKKITYQRPEVEVTYNIRDEDLAVDSFFMDRDAKESVESTWMRTMVDFGQFLAQAKMELKLAPIKIAIIDDGINPTLNIFSGRIKRGESFNQLGEYYNGRRGAFYVPSGPHGTLMAQLVCKVCPMVELYIAQLEVFRGQYGQRSFRAESAAEAVTWAVNQGVDIISMSWYIDEDKESDSLDDALRLADSAKIVMFCSSIDEGATETNKTYPGKIETCIKIGASTDTGAKLSWVSSNCHYLLPGDARHGKVGDEMRSGPHKGASTSSDLWSQNMMDRHGHFGSSVSTALAAGLAGTLIFSERLGRSEYPDRLRHRFDTPVRQERVDHLRISSHMKEAFNSLASEKFIHWGGFPNMGMEPWIWDSKKYENILVDFVNTIVK